MSECEHNHREYSASMDGCFLCRACRTYIPITWVKSDYDKGYRSGYAAGDAAGYARAKAEMTRKLDEFKPTYVDGGRVPEDAIEHRNQPRRTDGPSV